MRAALDLPALGAALHAQVVELYPIPRSLTGPGLRQTLDWIGERLPLARHEVPTGTRVLDWEVPREWRVRQAWVKDPAGRTVVDFAHHNLHLVGYSAPVHERMPRERLDEHLHSLPEHPDWIPYRTSYYRETWGFCLPHRVRQSLPPGEYEVLVDSELVPGALSYGELLLPGASARQVLLSCHLCHPALANDNLSALVVAVEVARRLAEMPARRLSWRFLFAPGTLGAIAWLAANRDAAAQVAAGLVLANLGDGGAFHYKRSRRGTAWIDRAVEQALATSGEPHGVRDFVPFGYDERQYNSPGFALPVGLLSRSPHGTFPEYHTSADDPSFVRPESLAGAVDRLLEIAAVLEGDRRYRSLAPYGEPQLGRRGLYRQLGGGSEGRERELALLWVLNLCDGACSLLDIARRAGMPFVRIEAAADALLAAGLLAPVDDEAAGEEP
ncbi:MAG TPA: DUF4910 domain-containing protein [Thermoanaerobaculia bacterium]|nr:DUF4910 domain-containing protein [Thermoanaerobaculia bacterium]